MSASPDRPLWPQINAWALFDFATTAYSMNIVSTYFALWATHDHGASDLQYGLTKSVSMLVVLLISPWLGAASDRLGRRKPFIVASTILFVVATAAMGLNSTLGVGLLLYGLSNLGYQLSLVCYNAMLPALAPVRMHGRVSGYGRALGYVGSLVAVFLGMAYATGKLFGHDLGWAPGGNQAVFLPTAVLVGVLALPLLLVREPAAPARKAAPPRPALATFRSLLQGSAPPGVALFLLGSFFFFDTINTIRDFMSIYLVMVVGLSPTGGSLQQFLARLVICSLLGALFWGWLSDRVGAKRALLGVLWTLAFGFAALMLFTSPLLVLNFWGPVLGVAFGGVLVTTRPLLAALIPPEQEGLYFGVFVLANDVAAILGPVTWGLTVKLLGAYGTVAYQAALGVQLFSLLAGIYCVTRVRLAPRYLR